ncbi:ribosome maturation factor RimM [Sphingomonas sp.]|uniref:ribosome maturation factor RimM n=1 Tax=Sphingomonas sp. TaxID=28214 RepID=UPI002FC75EC9
MTGKGAPPAAGPPPARPEHGPERDDNVALAAVMGAHGIQGEVRLKLFAESPASLQRHKQVMVGDRTLTLVAVKAAGKTPVARFAEINDRAAAEQLRGSLVTVPRSALPPLEDGEYYYAELLGLACESQAGETLGVVVAVENFGAGDVIEIEKPDGKRTMVPFRKDVADLVSGKIVVDPVFLA